MFKEYLLYFFRFKNYGVSAILLFIINIYLTTIPLTEYFSYEIAAMNAVFLVLIGGIFSITHIKIIGVRKFLRTFPNQWIERIAILLAIPFAIAFLNALLLKQCPFGDGIVFYMLITVPSVFIGVLLGYSALLINERYAQLIFLGFFLMLFVHPLLELFFYPQIYVFSPVIVQFSPVIYDELIDIGGIFLEYRFVSIAFYGFVAFGVYLAFTIEKELFRFVPAAILGVGFIASWIISPMLGYATTSNRLEEYLSSRFETEHFEIYLPAGIDVDEVSYIRDLHEYYYYELEDFFETAPEDKITSFIFRDGSQKKELYGAENADMAKPWLGQIYTTLDSYEATLKHELAHIFSAEFGKTFLRLSDGFNPGLLEGIAVAASPFYGEYPVEYLASLSYKSGYKLLPKQFLSGWGFFGSISSLAYINAGTFLKYVKEKFGIEKVKELYGNLDFDEVLGQSLDSLQQQYVTYLDTLTQAVDSSTAHFYFGRKPIFHKVCPRYVASERREAFRLYDKKYYQQAHDIFADLSDVTDDYYVLYGQVRALEHLSSYTYATELLQERLPHYDKTSHRYRSLLKLGDLSILSNKNENAGKYYDTLLTEHPTMYYRNLAEMRLLMMEDMSIIRNYVESSTYDRYEILKFMNADSLLFSTVPTMLELSKSFNQDYYFFISRYKKISAPPKNEQELYAYFVLADYAIKNLDLDYAKLLNSYALQYQEQSVYRVAISYQKMKIDWFLKHSK